MESLQNTASRRPDSPYAFPERDVVLDLTRGRHWRRIVPGRARIAFAADDNIVIVGHALPATHRRLIDGLKIIHANGFDGK